MNASLPAVRLIEDGSMVMDCRKIAAFTHLKYPKYLSRLRQKLDENPTCRKFFPGLPHPIPQKKSLEDYIIWSTASGVELLYHDGASRKALLGAFAAGPAPIQEDPEASGPDEAGSPKSTAGDDKFLIVRPSTDGGEPMADSRDVAQYFGKRHDDVLKAYRNLGCSLAFRRRNFAELYINGLDGSLSHVLMTKNGFAFLALGFTGDKADTFKEAFINKYDSMERKAPPGAQNTDWNDPAFLRQVLIGYTHKIEEANSRADAAESKANAETQRALNEEERANREEAAKRDAMLHAKEADETLESVLEQITEKTGNWHLEPFAQVQLHLSPVSQLRDAMLTDNNKMLKRHFYEPLGKNITLPEQWTIASLLLDTVMTKPAGLRGVQVPAVVATPKGQRYLLRRYWGKLKTAAPVVDPDQATLDLNKRRGK